MSTHIAAGPGQIAEDVLMPGDPLRAQWIAETFLDDAECYTRTRGMLGFTGTFEGRRVSVQGSGMGMPSIAIYATELIREYGAQRIIRVGSCGAMREEVAVRDVVIGMSACTDSAMNRVRFEGLDYAPTADYELLRAAADAARARGVRTHVGPIFSADSFYPARPELGQRLAAHGVLAVEMEAAALYTIAAAEGRRALAICTVSDHLITGEDLPAAAREQSFSDMVHIALDTVRDA